MTFLMFRIFDASESNRFRAGTAVSRNRQHLCFIFQSLLNNDEKRSAATIINMKDSRSKSVEKDSDKLVVSFSFRLT